VPPGRPQRLLDGPSRFLGKSVQESGAGFWKPGGAFFGKASSAIALTKDAQYAVQMQMFFSSLVYDADMANPANEQHLKKLREAAGLTQRELAAQIGEIHSNVNYWENSGNLPRSDVLLPMAKALGVSVEELLGEPRLKGRNSPAGKLRGVFDEASRLPRRQQQKLVEFVKLFIAQNSSEHQNGTSKAA
jgi:transcriptional regulator with XRE-family HTH domain